MNDYQDAYQKMMKMKEHHRTIEQIIEDIKSELAPVKEESFLVHAMRLITELDTRTTSPLYKHLQSPMKQTLYLIDIYFSINIREESIDMDDERWERIAILLDEIEMTYFIKIGFYNNGDIYHDERDKKIEVSLETFLGYFSNAVLSYEEQTLDKIVRYIKPYDKYIQSRYGFNTEEALKFVSHIRKLNNKKLNDIIQPYADTLIFYQDHPEEWQKLTRKFEERGIEDPCEWWYQPELSGMLKTLTTNPGEIFIHETVELMDAEIDHDSLQHLIGFFSYDKNSLKDKTIYYTDKLHSETHPLIRTGNKYVCIGNKFFLEGLYLRIDEMLSNEVPSGKYKQKKDSAFEKKVMEIFQHFFPDKTKIFTNYSVDGVSENDLLVIIGDTCIIVEIKNCKFRAPFRDPIKAYERIKRDYQNAIQSGYEQCTRVAEFLPMNTHADILDASSRKVLYRLKMNKIKTIRTVIVTDFKYGAIQTDLSKLLEKDNCEPYPWSVCMDDLEAFLLLMKKIHKAIAPARFLEFLDYREKLHGHLICFDELEICGWYLSARDQFKEYAGKDTIISTNSSMGQIFDAYYRIGIGFKNELDIEYKKHYELPDYPKNFNLNEISGEMIVTDTRNDNNGKMR